MTTPVTRIVLGAGAALLAVGVAAGAFVHAQDQNTNRPPRSFMGRGGPGGPGGSGRFGGPRGPQGQPPRPGRGTQPAHKRKGQNKTNAPSPKDAGEAPPGRPRAARP